MGLNANTFFLFFIVQTSPVSVCTETCFPGYFKRKQEGKPFCCFDCPPCPKEKMSIQKGKRFCGPSCLKVPQFSPDRSMNTDIEELSYMLCLLTYLGHIILGHVYLFPNVFKRFRCDLDKKASNSQLAE